MNPDQKLIQTAYEEAIKKLFLTLFDHYTMAASDDAQIKEADRCFTSGIGFARNARDRALALLG